MKQNWEMYRDTGMLGAYQPEQAVLREIQTGDVLTSFPDTELWEMHQQFIRERTMDVGGKVFHITSVFQDLDHATSTPTEKLLEHIDLQIKKESHSA